MPVYEVQPTILEFLPIQQLCVLGYREELRFVAIPHLLRGFAYMRAQGFSRPEAFDDHHIERKQKQQ
jgi:hypothetical protein